MTRRVIVISVFIAGSLMTGLSQASSAILVHCHKNNFTMAIIFIILTHEFNYGRITHGKTDT